MTTITLDELHQETSGIMARASSGEVLVVIHEGRMLARISPPQPVEESETKTEWTLPPMPKKRVDNMARLNALWGDRCFSMEEVERMKQDELDHELEILEGHLG